MPPPVVAAADQHAATTVARAAAESHQRVAEADAAVGALTDLRSQLLGQLGMLGAHLDQVRTLVAQAAPIVVPPEQEADRPVTAHFPPDPAGRPTPPPGFEPEPPQWAVPEQEPFVPPSAMAARETEEAHVDDGTESAEAPAATASPTDSNDPADPADPANTTDSADPANTTDPRGRQLTQPTLASSTLPMTGPRRWSGGHDPPPPVSAAEATPAGQSRSVTE